MERLFVLNSTLNEFPEKEVVIFGTGKNAVITLFKMFHAQKTVKAFCDTFDSSLNKKICNIPIISFRELKEQKKDVIVVIASASYEEIYNDLKELGFADILIDYDDSAYAVTHNISEFKKEII